MVRDRCTCKNSNTLFNGLVLKLINTLYNLQGWNQMLLNINTFETQRLYSLIIILNMPECIGSPAILLIHVRLPSVLRCWGGWGVCKECFSTVQYLYIKKLDI